MRILTGRNIPKNYRNITGKLSLSKSNELITYESKLERDFYLLFELEPDIFYIKDQPMTLQSKQTGIQYTPDFEIRIRLEKYNFKTIIGEFKYKKDLRKDWQTLKPKFNMAIEYCQNQENTEFKILTNQCAKISNANYLFNTHFLLNYKHFNEAHYDLLKKHFRKNISVKNLLERCSSDMMQQMELVNTLWYLVKMGAIKTDLYEQLTLHSQLSEFHSYSEPEKLILLHHAYCIQG